MDGFSGKREQENRNHTEKEHNRGDFHRGNQSSVLIIGGGGRRKGHIDHVDLRVTEDAAGSLRVNRDGSLQRFICLLRIRISNRHREQTGIRSGGRRNGWTDDILAPFQTQQHSCVFALNDIGEGLRKHLGGIAVQKIAVA